MQGSIVGGSGGSNEAPSSGFTSMDVTNDGSPIVDVLISPTFSSQELSILLDVSMLAFLISTGVAWMFACGVLAPLPHSDYVRRQAYAVAAGGKMPSRAKPMLPGPAETDMASFKSHEASSHRLARTYA